MKSLAATWVVLLSLARCGGDGFGIFGPPSVPSSAGPPFFDVRINNQSWPLPDSAIPPLETFNTGRAAIVATRPLGSGAWEVLQIEWAPANLSTTDTVQLAGEITGFATFQVYSNFVSTAFYSTTESHTGVLLSREISSDSLVAGAFAFEAATPDGKHVRHIAGQLRLRVVPP